MRTALHTKLKFVKADVIYFGTLNFILILTLSRTSSLSFKN